ncbi:acyl-CoA thioesterase [Winogradskyella sp. A3E31]|uniref:acyl-CoA thioesterase n=1 Tax=Winogradskyella sp. A3E31 TaxID=3349637 RepID=UPI00398AC164
MYKKQFEIRWNDIDANGHLANSAYTNFMSHARMSFFSEFGFSLPEIKSHKLGPVVFYEHMYYFKESFISEPITVTIELSGLSEDGMFFGFDHNFYNQKGDNLAFCEMQGGWIDLSFRKLSALPEKLLKLALQFPKSENFKTITKADTRKHGIKPKSLTDRSIT